MATIDQQQVRQKITEALPIRARWHVNGGTLDFDFARARRNLRPLRDSGTTGFEIPREWLALLLFGEQDYAEGGGATPFLGVHAETGQVFGLDVERESSPMYLLNSDIDRFIATFHVFDRALGRQTLPTEQIVRLAEEADPTAFAASEWHDLAAAIASGEDF